MLTQGLERADAACRVGGDVVRAAALGRGRRRVEAGGLRVSGQRGSTRGVAAKQAEVSAGSGAQQRRGNSTAAHSHLS